MVAIFSGLPRRKLFAIKKYNIERGGCKVKALSYLGPRQMIFTEKETPTPKKGEVLIRVRACGICGSDIHGYLGITGRRTPPVTMGHEFSGEIVSLGEGVSKFSIGDRVTVQPIKFCGVCDLCKSGMTNLCRSRSLFGVLSENGALAEYIAVPDRLLFKIPDNCSYEAAALTEPLAVSYGGLSKSGDLRGKSVAIVGAGTIGLCALALVKMRNPARIIVSDVIVGRLDLALEMGATDVVNPAKEDYLERISEITGGAMLDVSIECVGTERAVNQSIKSLAPSGVSVWLGMSEKEVTINMLEIVSMGRTIAGSYSYTHQEFGDVVELLSSGKLDVSRLVTARISLEEAPHMFERLSDKPDDFLKVVVNC